MPRIPGERGPAPRREAETRRTNNKGTATQLTPEILQELPFEIELNPQPTIPEGAKSEADETEVWHPFVQQFWDDLQRDPARKWMTSADWAAVGIFCESMSRELRPQVVGVVKETGEVVKDFTPVKSATLASFLKMLEHIGVTESARLRLSKEVTLFPREPVATEGNVVDINTARQESVQ